MRSALRLLTSGAAFGRPILDQPFPAFQRLGSSSAAVMAANAIQNAAEATKIRDAELFKDHAGAGLL